MSYFSNVILLRTTNRLFISLLILSCLVIVPTFLLAYQEYHAIGLITLLKAQVTIPKLWTLDFITAFTIFLIHTFYFPEKASSSDSKQKISLPLAGLIWGILLYITAASSLIYHDEGFLNFELYMQYQSNHPIMYGLAASVPFLLFLGFLAKNTALKEEFRKQLTKEMANQNEKLNREIEKGKAREKELAEAKKQALAGVKAKDQFFSNMSHEIRTPMNGVIGLTNLLLDTDLSEEQKKYLNAIEYSAKNLMVLINQILDLSKINSEKLTLEYINFDLREAIKGVENTFLGTAMDKGLILRTIVDASVPQKVVGDPIRLHQILLNLVGNSIKFTSEGGIDILIKSQTTDDGPRLLAQVNDTGIGISEEKLPHIFESFSQAGTETTRMYGGSGLGLAITKELIGLYGGSINVESEIGKGSSFSFQIQLKNEDERLTVDEKPKEKKSEPASLTNTTGIQILLAEDNKVNQLVAKSVLIKQGFANIDVAATGQEVIDRVFEKAYDIILMDIQMPVMSGLDATRFIRNAMDAPASNVKILALTASAMEEDIQKCYAVGMDDHLPKPFSPEDLLEKLNEHLAVSQ